MSQQHNTVVATKVWFSLETWEGGGYSQMLSNIEEDLLPTAGAPCQHRVSLQGSFP